MTHIYSYPELSMEEKITNEKRRRNQLYNTLDYKLSLVSYFDFFSSDTFDIASNSAHLANLYNQDVVNTDMVLLAFFDEKTEFAEYLRSFGLNEEKMFESFKLLRLSPRERKIFSFLSENLHFKTLFIKVKDFLLPFQEKTIDNIEFSDEVYDLFEKCGENAFHRFKTLVITPEILLITLMEEANTRAAKLIHSVIADNTQWHILKYSLIKRIHFQEASLRSEVPQNQHYFAYLLKTQLTSTQFDLLINDEKLKEGVSIFRNLLVSSLLETNFFDLVAKDLYASLRLTSIRRYSS